MAPTKTIHKAHQLRKKNNNSWFFLDNCQKDYGYGMRPLWKYKNGNSTKILIILSTRRAMKASIFSWSDPRTNLSSTLKFIFLSSCRNWNKKEEGVEKKKKRKTSPEVDNHLPRTQINYKSIQPVALFTLLLRKKQEVTILRYSLKYNRRLSLCLIAE